jgi:hypothetical protein
MSSSRGRPAAESGQGYEQSGEYQQSGAYSSSQSGGYPQGSSYATETRDTHYTGQRRASPGAMAGTILAGVLMIIGGAIGFLNGLGMVIHGGFYAFHSGYAYVWTTANWGYAQLILGGLIFFAGFCVLLGMTWARVLGVILATVSAVASFLTIPYYPVWSIVAIAIDLFIIWALLYPRRQAV